jgi:hypothetical protein
MTKEPSSLKILNGKLPLPSYSLVKIPLAYQVLKNYNFHHMSKKILNSTKITKYPHLYYIKNQPKW